MRGLSLRMNRPSARRRREYCACLTCPARGGGGRRLRGPSAPACERCGARTCTPHRGAHQSAWCGAPPPRPPARLRCARGSPSRAAPAAWRVESARPASPPSRATKSRRSRWTRLAICVSVWGHMHIQIRCARMSKCVSVCGRSRIRMSAQSRIARRVPWGPSGEAVAAQVCPGGRDGRRCCGRDGCACDAGVVVRARVGPSSNAGRPRGAALESQRADDCCANCSSAASLLRACDGACRADATGRYGGALNSLRQVRRGQ